MQPLTFWGSCTSSVFPFRARELSLKEHNGFTARAQVEESVLKQEEQAQARLGFRIYIALEVFRFYWDCRVLGL